MTDLRPRPEPPVSSAATDRYEVWLLRLHNGRLSYHSYKDAATREKWAARYRERGDRVSYDYFIREEAERV